MEGSSSNKIAKLIEVERDPTQVKLLAVDINELTVTESLVISTFYSS